MCGNSSSTAANTTNTSQTQAVGGGSTTAGGNISGSNIGLTGANATQLAKILSQAGAYYAQAGFDFSTVTQGRAFDTVDRTAAQVTSSLSSIIDATRDFSQRALSGSTGQSTPIINLPAAGSSPAIIPAFEGGGGGGVTVSPVMLVAAAGLAVVLLKK